MIEWYPLLVPLGVLAALMLFRFVGCDDLFGLDEIPEKDYPLHVKADAPVIYLRLQEAQLNSPPVAKDEMEVKEGRYGRASSPLSAGDPNWSSTEVPVTELQLGVTDDPKLLATEAGATSVRVHGGEIIVAAHVAPRLQSLTEFTLELLVCPEWDVVAAAARGKYYCVMELAAITTPAPGDPLRKNAGFGIYAGPDTDPTSPYVWQFWVGTGQGGFQRLNPVQPYQDPQDPGPTVTTLPTYLAVTFSQPQGKAFLYSYYAGRNFSNTQYELVPLNYIPAIAELFIGLAEKGPLFPPFPFSPDPLYPFKGRMAEVAIYDIVLEGKQILDHGMRAFTG
jgi:hypothetical protein